MTADDSFLSGIRVIDLGHYIAGPGVCATLANLGADVIKIEPLDGESARHIGNAEMVRSFSHSRRSIAIDLRADEGLDAAKRLIASADVVVQNLRPGATVRLGLDAETLREQRPGLIYLTVAGYPTGGPSAMRPGYDVAAQAESGMMWVTGEPGRPPQVVGAAIVDVATNHIGAQAVLAAIVRRQRTGLGASLEVSLLEVAVALQAQRWGMFLLEAQSNPCRTGGRQPNVAPASDLYRTSDGYITLSAYRPDHWHTLCAALGKESLATDPRFATNEARLENREALDEILSTDFRTAPGRHWVELLSGQGIVVGVVNSYPDARASVDLASSQMLQETLAGDDTVMGLPYRSSEVARRAPSQAPALGEHTRAILNELGYAEPEIARLIETRVVRSDERRCQEPTETDQWRP